MSLQGAFYVGCGNGRNYLPLVDAGLDLVGLDVSHTAINQILEKEPQRRGRLICGDLGAMAQGLKYPVVIGIQVFQHGDRGEAHSHIEAAKSRVAERGLFCIRVNAAGTDIEHKHEVVEEDADGGFTIRYLQGPKEGLLIHFFAREELTSLFAGWDEVLPVRIDENWRKPRARGRWLQWEAIWKQ